MKQRGIWNLQFMTPIGGHYTVILMLDPLIYSILGNTMSTSHLLWCHIVLALFPTNNEAFGNIFPCFIYSTYFLLKNWLKKRRTDILKSSQLFFRFAKASLQKAIREQFAVLAGPRVAITWLVPALMLLLISGAGKKENLNALHL